MSREQPTMLNSALLKLVLIHYIITTAHLQKKSEDLCNTTYVPGYSTMYLEYLLINGDSKKTMKVQEPPSHKKTDRQYNTQYR